MMAGDIARVARAALETGRSRAGAIRRPALSAHPADARAVGRRRREALAGLGEAALEYKMDGARVQVHKSGDDVIVYSRSLKDVTPAVPEVVEVVRALPAQRPDSGRRSDQPAPRWPAAALSDHDAALRPQSWMSSGCGRSCP